MNVDGVRIFVDEKDFSEREVKYYVELAKSRLSESETLTELYIHNYGDKVELTLVGVFEKTGHFVRPTFAGA